MFTLIPVSCNISFAFWQFDYLVGECALCSLLHVRCHFIFFNKVCFPYLRKVIAMMRRRQRHCIDAAWHWRSVCHVCMWVLLSSALLRFKLNRIHVNQMRISRCIYIWWIGLQMQWNCNSATNVLSKSKARESTRSIAKIKLCVVKCNANLFQMLIFLIIRNMPWYCNHILMTICALTSATVDFVGSLDDDY